MPWFSKRSGLHRQEELRWQLRLRLTRWRHFLAAETACFDLLTDLREKLSGDYIFDRQYVYSTLGRIFQSAYQVAHDSGILAGSDDAAMFLWLDRVKENAYSRAAEPPAAGIQSHNQDSAATEAEQEDWADEPEYRMIEGVLGLLDPKDLPATSHPTSDSGAPPAFLHGLQHAHEQALQDLMALECLRAEPGRGTAVRCGEASPFTLWVIDLRTGSNGPESTGQDQAADACTVLHSMPWLPLREGLAAAAVPANTVEPVPLLLVAGENALFMTGMVAGRKLTLDVVLTAVRELNHWFLRWEGDSSTSPFCREMSALFAPESPRSDGICQSQKFCQTAEEITDQLHRLGKALTLQAAGTAQGDIRGGSA